MTSSRAEATVARARALLGTRFVPHGRDPARGLDCVGLVAAALGLVPPTPRYDLRCGNMIILEGGLVEAGLIKADAPTAGDVLALGAGPRQLHLGLWTGTSLIHADAGSRCVVERPAPLPWPVLGTWRVPDEEDATWRP